MFPEVFVSPDSVAWAPGRTRKSLPHLEKAGCSYFVTFCLRDARVAPRRDNPTGFEGITAASEPLACGSKGILADLEVATIVEETLLHFQGERYLLSAWCVMPDHVHTVVTPLDGRALSAVLQAWKSFSAHRINALLARNGPVWQEESFDHVIRTPEAFRRFVAYVEANPVAASLCEHQEEWPVSSARFARVGD